MPYNGLKGDMNTLAKFVFIYEKKIKHKSRVDEFTEVSAEAMHVFKHDIQSHIKFATKEEIANQTDFSKQTLFFTGDGKAQIYNFCRHLRNSFGHAILEKNSNLIYVNDKDSRGRKTSVGFLSYKVIKAFIVPIIQAYEVNI